MVYRWKLPGVIPVDAQTAGEELQRIFAERGELEPADIVAESRDVGAPLHPCFEWNDEVAAEKYRQTQAAKIVRSILTVEETTSGPQEVRAFVHVQEKYCPISVVVNNADKMADLLEAALEELKAFRNKYRKLSELSAVMSAIDEVVA